MPFLNLNPKGYFAQPLKSFYLYRIPKLVKVKAYNRIRPDEVEKFFCIIITNGGDVLMHDLFE